MRIKTIKLDDLTRDILLRSAIIAKCLTLPEQLERSEYAKVAKAIEAAGGKWNRKNRCHVFPDDVRKCMEIDAETVSIVNLRLTTTKAPTKRCSIKSRTHLRKQVPCEHT